MATIKKSTTLILFFLLIVSIVFFAASVIVYQGSLTRINDDLRNKNQDIITRDGLISGFQINVSRLQEALSLQLLREQNLTGLFTDVKTEKENLEDEKASLEKEMALKQKELASAKVEIGNLESQMDANNLLYLSLNESYQKAISDVVRICNDASSLNISRCRRYE